MFSSHPDFTPNGPSIDARIETMLQKLSLEEKIDLLSGAPTQGSTRANENAGIIEYKMADGPVGVHWWCEASTAYPTSVSAAATFNRELVGKMGWGLGRDGRARGVHILLAPGVNMYRLPVCGRNFEYFGEDPFLASEVAVEYIRGVQSQGVCTTVKHFALNYQEFERHLCSADVDERTLHEFYLPAFEAAVKRGGTGALMTAYNLLNGVHCSESQLLIREILKGRWGFDGYVMSDWVSVYSDVPAANAGLDLEMPSPRWFDREHLVPAVKDGRVSEAVIDDKIRRLLRLGLCFGWYDREQKVATIPEDDPETVQVALDLAREGVVLLKNEGGILPLIPTQKILLIGPHAEAPVIGGGGSAYNKPFRAASLLEAVRALLGENAHVMHQRGYEPERALSLFDKSEFLTPTGERGILGEYWNNESWSGEPFLSRVDERVDFAWQWKSPAEGLPNKKISMRWRGFVEVPRAGRYRFYVRCNHGDYTLLLNGKKALAFSKLNLRRFPDVVELELPAGRVALELSYTRPRDDDAIQLAWESADAVAEMQREGLKAAKDADVVVACFGFTRYTESECDDREYALPQDVTNYLQKVAQITPNVVGILYAGGSVDAAPFVGSVRGLVHAFYPGQEGAQALAEILFGKTNPSAKLPFTWEKRLEDRIEFASYYDHDGDNRVTMESGIFGGYRHFDRDNVEPLFAFGYGLSYTSFEYSALALSSPTLSAEGTLGVSCAVTNTGKHAGSEAVQLYISHREPRLVRPPQELKGFAKVRLLPGETKRVEMQLPAAACCFYDPEQQAWVFEPGEFEVRVGSSSRDIRLTAKFRTA
ncbi:MAG: glycoside hydrolase family 3 C-terminal domain-containing protein [Polyangiaceae bacterium]|nr:glycoside hydrolase family 3 C-terminal domain-containing protein [Polyangiaceae bacterium]